MTINLSTNSPRVSYTVSEGATTSSFTVSFEFFAAADLNVYVDGATKVLGSGSGQYAVSGGDGSTGAVALSVTGATGGSTVVITRDIGLERTTDFPSSGSFQISTLNTELDRFVAIAADLKDSSDRALQISDFDPAVSLVIPAVATRKGTVLGFNASTGAVEAGPNITAVQSLSAVTTAINLLGTSAVVTDLGILATAAIVEDMSLLATSANVTAMGLLGNSTTIADLAILATTDVVADLAILATSDIVTDLNVLATSDIVTDLNVLATSDIVTDLNVLATTSIVADMAALADGGALNITGTPSFNASLGVKNGATSAGYINFFEDSNNGTNKVTLIGPAATADVTLTLPASADTLVGRATTDTLTNKTLTSPDINSPDIDGGTIDAITRLTTLAEDVTFSSTVANKPIVTIENTTNHSGAATLRFINTRTGSSGQDNDPAGTIEFKGENDNNESIRYASIEAYALDVSDGDEGGKLALSVASHDGQGSYGLVLQDGNADDEVDVTIASGAASITTVEGTLTMGSTATLNNTGVLQTAAQTNITSVGTLTSVDVTGVAGAATFEPDGDTAAGDNAAIGYTAAEGLILTGQGSTGDVTIKNDADAVVLQVPTGTTDVNIVGNLDVDGTANLDAVDIDGAVDIAAGLTVRSSALLQAADGDFTFYADSNHTKLFHNGVIRLTTTSAGMTLNNAVTLGSLIAEGDLTAKTSDGALVVLQSSDTTITDGSVLGGITFNAPNEASGTAALLVGASILAVAEGTFAADNNATELVFKTGASEVAATKMTLSSAGNLTVTGDVNVGADLDVTGAAVIDTTCLVTGALTTTVGATFNNGGTAVDFLVKSDDNAAMFFVNGSEDKIGIGTTTVQGTLNVGGDTGGDPSMYLLGSRGAANNLPAGHITFRNVANGVGDIDLSRIQSLTGGTGSGQTALGQMAFSTSNGSSLVEAFRITSAGNIIIGNSGGTLSTTTAGTHNLRLGPTAGDSITSGGDYNTLLGSAAGTAITASGYNVAVGYQALTTNTIGSMSIAVGANALRNQEPASAIAMHNTAVGHSAGEAVVTGTHNTLIGSKAGSFATTAENSTFVGYQAGQGITGVKLTGNNNTAVGKSAGLLLQGVAIENTLIGSTSGADITTGDYNVTLGYRAGAYDTDLVTGSYNTILGGYCHTSAADSANQIVMGHDVTGNGDNTLCFGTGATTSAIAFGEDSITTPSDERHKEDIADATAGLSFIKDLRPVTFKWKKEKDVPADHKAYREGSEKRVMLSNGETNHGFIAQEVKTAIDAHSEIKDGFNMWSAEPTDGRQRLGPSALIPMLTKAIQELSAKNDALAARIAVLEG